MNIVAKANEVRKAILAAVSALTILVNANGVPTELVPGAKTVIAVAAVFGIVYKVSNKQQS